MSATTTSASAQTSSCENGKNLYNTPIENSLCAMAYGGNHTDIMSNCCGDAEIVSYYDDCGIYCLATDKNVSDIVKCLYKNGASWSDVFCKGSGTATGTATAIPTSADATVIASGGSTKTKSADSSSSAKSTSSGSAAVCQGPQHVFTTVGFVISSLLLSAAFFGALQV